jgi:hypothetical protein
MGRCFWCLFDGAAPAEFGFFCSNECKLSFMVLHKYPADDISQLYLRHFEEFGKPLKRALSPFVLKDVYGLSEGITHEEFRSLHQSSYTLPPHCTRTTSVGKIVDAEIAKHGAKMALLRSIFIK